MRQIMQKALSAMGARRDAKMSDRKRRPSGTVQPAPAPSEDWGMSPEDALKASMVSGYK
jgi:hypothetical protein